MPQAHVTGGGGGEGCPPSPSHLDPGTPTHPSGSGLAPPTREGKKKGLRFNCACVLSLGPGLLFVTPRTAARQAPLSLGFSGQECC